MKQIQLCTLSTQYVAEFNIQLLFASAQCYTRCTSFDTFLFLVHFRVCYLRRQRPHFDLCK